MRTLSITLAFLCITVLFFSRTISSGERVDEQSNESVLARIGDEVITKGNLEAALNRIPQNRRGNDNERLLDRLIEVKVFSMEARKSGLDDDPQIKESIESTTKETLARYFVKKYIDRQAEPSEEEIKKYYKKERKEQFVVPEGVLIQHILVKRKEQAEALLKELKEGASFEKLAKKKSIARSWKKGGVLGWLFKGKMDPELEKVAFNLKIGTLSDVIQTREGYQIIKVLNKSDKRNISLETARAKIRYTLFWKKKRELIDKYYEEAKVNKKPNEKGVLFKIGDEAFKEEIIEPILSKASEKERKKLKPRWVNYLIETTVFSREARKVGLEKDPEFADELQRKTEEILAGAFKKRFINDKIQVSDNEVADYYQSHSKEFKVPPLVRVKTIRVKTEEEAENILRELKEGAEFDTLAEEKSTYPSDSKGGDIGWFGKGAEDPALEKAAFSLEKGQMSGIIKTKGGYQIIKVVDKRDKKTWPLSKVKERVRMRLIAQKFQEEKQRYYEKAEVEIRSIKN